MGMTKPQGRVPRGTPTGGRFAAVGRPEPPSDELAVVDAGDRPVEIWPDGTQVWRDRWGALHRVDGPAVIRPDGGVEFWQNGFRDRHNGPAVIHADGAREWWILGELCMKRKAGESGEYSYKDWLLGIDPDGQVPNSLSESE